MYEVTDINKRAERCIILFVQALLNNAIFFYNFAKIYDLHKVLQN
jgi:hypothetical protein